MKALKVYDSDFTDEQTPILIVTAMSLLANYRGNWEALCNYKRLFQNGELMPPKVARQVLNMFLSDSTQQATWETIRTALNLRETTRPQLKIVRNVPQEDRKCSVRTRLNVHVPYGHPRQRNGSVHRVGTGSYVDWQAHHAQPWEHIDGEPWYDFSRRTPRFYAKWVCQEGSWRSCERPVLVAEIPEGRNLCPRCFPDQ